MGVLRLSILARVEQICSTNGADLVSICPLRPFRSAVAQIWDHMQVSRRASALTAVLRFGFSVKGCVQTVVTVTHMCRSFVSHLLLTTSCGVHLRNIAQ